MGLAAHRLNQCLKIEYNKKKKVKQRFLILLANAPKVRIISYQYSKIKSYKITIWLKKVKSLKEKWKIYLQADLPIVTTSSTEK